ncbi:MAG TPA: LLM class flavin-dependent oxidoreductase, partial [Alphaproteobacteria bacterium]|nr:LLM class flavin-dependent oxidoreductase [Alphaproteobacteria bacterium]
ENWKIANEIAQETRGKPMDPRRLRLVGPVHIAETREKARENVQFGIHKWLDYFSRINPTSSAQVDNRGGDPVDTMIASGSAVIGTPDDAVAQIRRLQDKQGDFGCFLQLAHNWADFDSTKKSYELWQRYVMPQLTGANRNRDISLEWTTEHGERLMGGAMKAAMEMFEKHQKEQAAKAKEEAS